MNILTLRELLNLGISLEFKIGKDILQIVPRPLPMTHLVFINGVWEFYIYREEFADKKEAFFALLSDDSLRKDLAFLTESYKPISGDLFKPSNILPTFFNKTF